MECGGHGYVIKYMLPEQIKNFSTAYTSPAEIAKKIYENQQVITFVGFNISDEKEYKGGSTKLVIKFNDLFYITNINYLERCNYHYKGTITCTNENIYYYLYGKRPLNVHKLKIVKIPDKKEIKSKERIFIECQVCNHTYDISINKFLSNKKCPKCTNQRIESADDIKKHIIEHCTHNNLNVLSFDKDNVPKDSLVNLECKICSDKFSRAVVSCRAGKIICENCDYVNENNYKSYIYKRCSIDENAVEYSSVGKIINQSSRLNAKCLDCGYQYTTSVQDATIGKLCSFCKGAYTEENYLYRIKLKRDYESEGYTITNAVIDAGIESKLNITCPNGHKIIQSISQFIRPVACSECYPKFRSKGETKIAHLLDIHNIQYESEYRFDDCRNVYPLKFDFYIESLNLCIEYDGAQHYHPTKFYGGNEKYLQQIKNDEIKNLYCIENNINLLRITYKDDIVTKLSEYFDILDNTNKSTQ